MYMAVVFWRPDDKWKAAISLHLVRGKINPQELKSTEGISIQGLCRQRKISLTRLRTVLPRECIVSLRPDFKRWRWNMLRELSLPMDREGLRRWARLVRMPVVAYICFRLDHEPLKLLAVRSS